MGIDSQHPDYQCYAPDWDQMRDTFAGQRTIKTAGFTYLPPTSGMLEDGINVGQAGLAAYNAYLVRSIFPDIVGEAIEVMIGVMHREAATIRLPDSLAYLMEFATRRGESLTMFLRRINTEQLLYGRYGVLTDIAADKDRPFFVGYQAPNIINWDDDREMEFEPNQLNLAVTHEDVPVRGMTGEDMFAWDEERRFRAMYLDESGVYTTFTEYDDTRSPEVQPSLRGQTLPYIPFTFIGSRDLTPKPDVIPLLGLSDLSLSIYRAEADYRQSLFMQGQDTLVVQGGLLTGEDEAQQRIRIGAGAHIHLEEGGDAKFIGVNGDGLGEQRKSISDLYERAMSRGSRLLEPRGSQAESGTALKVRVSASTTSLFQVALAGAAGLREGLKTAALWMGENPEDVVVTPNLDFIESSDGPEGLDSFMDAVSKGAPISEQSIHKWAKKNEMTDLEFDLEVKLLEGDAERRSKRITVPGATQDENTETDETNETDEDETTPAAE